MFVVTSNVALRVSAQCSITLAAGVGVCPCAQAVSHRIRCVVLMHGPFMSWMWSLLKFSQLVAVQFSRGRGTHFRLCPRPCSSTHRSAKPTTERHRGLRNTARSVLSRPLHPCTHRMCVIAKGQGSLQRLAHAAGHGQHSSASTSKRFFCVT